MSSVQHAVALRFSLLLLLIMSLLVLETHQRPLSKQEFMTALDEATKVTNGILKDMFDEWQISKYPNFLQSAAMTHTSWEVLKIKYQQKLLQQALSSNPINMVISFMGSSVTAGHDSPFNVSFPILTQHLMAPAFEPLGIHLHTRNAAMGNNPCMPYDVCVKTFAGADADIVHWEQSFNCFITEDDTTTKSIFEQFVRQSIFMPSTPVVVFSQSDTPNWSESECTDNKNRKPPTITRIEEELLESYHKDPMNIATHLNKNEITKWHVLLDVLKSYKTAGVQVFSHTHYEKYKCFGVYDKSWGCCSASWHPSLKGHELRAAHYAFFWLMIYKDAITELHDKLASNHTETFETYLEKVSRHIQHEHLHIPKSPLFNTNVSDGVNCYTNFEPRYGNNTDLESLIVPNKHQWNKAIFEEFVDKDIIIKARSRGYLDYKYMFYGNKTSGPLSLNVHVRKEGHLYMCQTPGNWGKLPPGFTHFWDVETPVYLQLNTEGTISYNFDSSRKDVKLWEYFNDKPSDSQHVCVQFVNKVTPGKHVISIVPISEKNIILSMLIVP